MVRQKATLFLAVILILLDACVQTSDLYAIRQWPSEKRVVGIQPDDRPRVDLGELEPKASFVDVVHDQCKAENIGDTDSTIHGFQPNTWAHKYNLAAVCVERIAAYATDQCVMITRRQNVVAADANLALGVVTLGSGLAAVGYAIKGSANDRLAATSLAGAASASNTGRAFLPTNTTVKLADFLQNAFLYAEFVGLDDEDVLAARDFNLPKTLGVSTQTAGEAGDNAMIKMARIHDAVFAACSANAYGIVPAAKPRH